MGRYGIFPISLGSSHKRNLTPHIAISLFAIVQFLIPTVVLLISWAGGANAMQIGAPIDVFNDAGLLGAMGFCVAYVLISLATPFYLKKIGELKVYHIAICVIALALLLVPIIGPFWPVPAAYPTNFFPYIVGVYLLIGAITVFKRSKTTSEMDSVRKVLEEKAMQTESTPSPVSPSLPGHVAMA
jgi:amino acid transporter